MRLSKQDMEGLVWCHMILVLLNEEYKCNNDELLKTIDKIIGKIGLGLEAKLQTIIARIMSRESLLLYRGTLNEILNDESTKGNPNDRS